MHSIPKECGQNLWSLTQGLSPLFREKRTAFPLKPKEIFLKLICWLLSNLGQTQKGDGITCIRLGRCIHKNITAPAARAKVLRGYVPKPPLIPCYTWWAQLGTHEWGVGKGGNESCFVTCPPQKTSAFHTPFSLHPSPSQQLHYQQGQGGVGDLSYKLSWGNATEMVSSDPLRTENR